MTIELGILLGQYGGPQSFEAPGSWQLAGAASLHVAQALVHSSPGGGWLAVASAAAGGSLSYSYAAADDAYARWSPDVATHALVALLWAAVDRATDSGALVVTLAGVGSTPIGYGGGALLPWRLTASAVSGGPVALAFGWAAAAGSRGLYLDDVTTYVDPLTVMPLLGALDQGTLAVARHQTSARVAEWPWAYQDEFALATPEVPSSWADLANRWWRGGRPLLLNRDTADPARRYVALLRQQPAPKLAYPYFNQSPLALKLTALAEGLNF